MGLNNDIARSHLETLIERIMGIDKAIPDRDGDYLIRTEHAGFFVRVDGDEPPVMRMFSVVVADIDKSPELLEAVNDLNTKLAFLRAMWVNRQVMIEGETLALTADVHEFHELCRRIATATDLVSADFLARFGGRPFFEATKEPGYHPEAPELPGYL